MNSALHTIILTRLCNTPQLAGSKSILQTIYIYSNILKAREHSWTMPSSQCSERGVIILTCPKGKQPMGNDSHFVYYTHKFWCMVPTIIASPFLVLSLTIVCSFLSQHASKGWYSSQHHLLSVPLSKEPVAGGFWAAILTRPASARCWARRDPVRSGIADEVCA